MPVTMNRLISFGYIATHLALLSDRHLTDLLTHMTTISSSGIGGDVGTLQIDGTPIFVKKIRLTDIERRPENIMSTRNLFDLPTYCQYGMGGSIGSPGFGVWRELATN